MYMYLDFRLISICVLYKAVGPADHFFGRICYPPYHFFAVSATSVVLNCDLIPSNHQILIRLSLTHVVNRHSQGVKTIRPEVTAVHLHLIFWLKFTIIYGILSPSG